MTTTPKAYENAVENQWCPGCPNYGILNAVKKSLAQLDLSPHDVCFVSGIGQAAKLPHYLKANVYNGLHGRAIPAAIGIHMANPALKTIVTSGDGDLYGEGGNHFIHALRRNPDITLVVHNNRLYALTKGQASPTTRRGETTRLQFHGVDVDPAQMLATAIVHDCTFVARGFAGDIDGLADLLTKAIEHRGLSIVDVVQPCITWGTHPVKWFMEHVEPVPEDHDPGDKNRALSLAMETADRFPIGVLYRGPAREIFGERYRERVGSKPMAALGRLSREEVTHRLERFLIDEKKTASDGNKT